MKLRKLASAWLAAALLAGLWLLPPAYHSYRRLCPVRPDGVRSAEALPAFARKYNVSCTQCHSGYPVLNAYGREFKMNGFVRKQGSDEGVLKTQDAELWFEKIFPWAVIVRSRPFDNGKGAVANQGTQMGGTSAPNPNGFKSQPLNDVDFFVAGGDAAKRVSYFGEMDANAASSPSFGPSLGDLRFGYHPYSFANIILARRGFFTDDPYQTISSNESPTIANRATDLLMTNQGSISGNAVTGGPQMLAVNGSASLPGTQGFLYYAVGATKTDNLGRQANAPTNGNLRLAYDNGSGFMFGAFGVYGHEYPASLGGSGGGLGVDPNNTAIRDKEQFVRGGFDALLERGNLALRGAFLASHDGDPAAAAPRTASDRAAYVEAAYYYKRGDAQYPFLVPLLRENWYTTFNGTQQFNYITAQLAHYFASNVKAFGEFSFDTKRAYQGGTLAAPTASPAVLTMRGNRATLQVEVGF